MLDHILLGCSDLDRGIDFVERHTGVRAALGGVHPGAGTRNALLSLGERRYVEIIAPDPGQDNVRPDNARRLSELKTLTEPRLVGWAEHPGDIETFAKRIRDQGIAIEGPFPGSRVRPDGRVLKWKTVSLADDRQGLLPFFIEWDAGSVHPSSDAPGGCRLDAFAVAETDPDSLAAIFARLGIAVPVERGDKAHLRARIRGPKGVLEVNS